LNLTKYQVDALDTLAEKQPNCRVVGYLPYDDDVICPVVAWPRGKTAELRPNGRFAFQKRNTRSAS